MAILGDEGNRKLRCMSLNRVGHRGAPRLNPFLQLDENYTREMKSKSFTFEFSIRKSPRKCDNVRMDKIIYYIPL